MYAVIDPNGNIVETGTQAVRGALKQVASLPRHACDDARNLAGLEVAINAARTALGEG